jgi:hypothetical protein
MKKVAIEGLSLNMQYAPKYPLGRPRYETQKPNPKHAQHRNNTIPVLLNPFLQIRPVISPCHTPPLPQPHLFLNSPIQSIL